MNGNLAFVPLRDRADLLCTAADWFSGIWRVPRSAYVESIGACQSNKSGIPQWYLVFDGDRIVGGLGVIENDFHKRHDLTPNICAVYVDKEYRKRGIAREMMNTVCRELAKMGIGDVYLLTDHTEFYEKCGWEFYDIVEEDGGDTARMYHRKLSM